MTGVAPDPGSFRDPASRVFLDGPNVLRALTPSGLADFEALSASGFYTAATADGRMVPTQSIAKSDIPAGLPSTAAAALRHKRVPFISYPYEWTFAMLRDAALLTLELSEEAFAAGLSVKDASAYNVQFLGAKPQYIDIGSFEMGRPGEPWYGYQQFCQHFLFPLMLQAYKDIGFQPLLRADLDGISINQARRMLPSLIHPRRGVFKHVVLHSWMQRTNADRTKGEDVKGELGRAGFSSELIQANIRNLHKLVDGLGWTAPSAWQGYRADNSYTADDVAVKSRIVEQVISRVRRREVWDLGANDGHFSEIMAPHSELVVALDSDHSTVDNLYRKLRAAGERRILPLVMDLSNPSPAQGWRGAERRSLASRSQPDVVVALALVHHLAISRAVPLLEIAGWLADLSPEIVVELPLPSDPQVSRLLRNKRQGVELLYSEQAFEDALRARFEVRAKELLPSGTRLIYHCIRRTVVVDS